MTGGERCEGEHRIDSDKEKDNNTNERECFLFLERRRLNELQNSSLSLQGGKNLVPLCLTTVRYASSA